MAFQRADTSKKPPKRLVTAVWGQEKVGKSTFALSFPDPIFYFNFDYGVQKLIDSGEYADREIYIINYPIPTTASVREHKPLLMEFEKQWKEAINEANARAGSVVLDTADEQWAIVGNALTGEIREARHERNAEEGKNAQDTRLDWRAANTFEDAILKRPWQFPNVSACLINRAQEIYDGGGKPSGQFKMHGYKWIPYIVDMVVRLHVKQRMTNVNGRTILEQDHKATLECIGPPSMQQHVGLELADPSYDLIMDLLS